MVDAKIVVVSVVALLSVFHHIEIGAQSTIGSSSEDGSCTSFEEGCEFQAIEIMHLRSELEIERQKVKNSDNVPNNNYCRAKDHRRLSLQDEDEQIRQRSQESQTVTATFIHKLEAENNFSGVTKVEDKIYVINDHPNGINVYEDKNDFRLIEEIELKDIARPIDIVYSSKSKFVYISGSSSSPNSIYCIWAMTTTVEHRLTTWLTNITVSSENTLALSNYDGHLLVLREGRLDVYSLNASLLRSVQFAQDVKRPRHVVQTSAGNFIIIHQQGPNWGGPFRLSQLTNNGQLINRYPGRNQFDTLNHPNHLALDSDNNRLFVADSYNDRVLIFDMSALNFTHVLLSYRAKWASYPQRLFYDACQMHLIVAIRSGNTTVYQIN